MKPPKEYETHTVDGVSQLFGQGGYITLTNGKATAHITKPHYRLSAPNFSEYFGEEQILPIVSLHGLEGMLCYLKVPATLREQKRLVSYLAFQKTVKKDEQYQYTAEAYCTDSPFCRTTPCWYSFEGVGEQK